MVLRLSAFGIDANYIKKKVKEIRSAITRILEYIWLRFEGGNENGKGKT